MNKKHEPKFHIVKRDGLPWQKAWGIRAIAILLALVVCAIITMIFTGDNPVQVYVGIFQGAFGSARKSWITLQNMSVLLIISLALTPAFKMTFWNIGGEGQVLMGGLATAATMIYLDDKVPGAVLIILMLVAAIVAGAFWGFLPALFKAIWGTNETLATLMMNYIAIQLVAYYVIVWEVPKGSGNVGIINQDSMAGWLPQLGGNKYLLTIVIALVVTLGMYIYLRFSRHGYEIAVVGESVQTARYVGIDVKKVIIRTMCVSGGLCGLAGFLLVGGINHTISTGLVDGQGFTAVMVSWLAKFNPVIMIFTSLLIIFFDRGASEISSSLGLNESYSDIITGIILFFIIGSEFFIRYKISKANGKEAA